MLNGINPSFESLLSTGSAGLRRYTQNCQNSAQREKCTIWGPMQVRKSKIAEISEQDRMAVGSEFGVWEQVEWAGVR